MKIYINEDYQVFNSNFEKRLDYCISAKDMVFLKPKLVAVDDSNKVIFRVDDTQPLYLFPLNILDYVKNIDSNKSIVLNILDFDNTIDYVEYIKCNNCLSVVVNINKELSKNDISKIIAIKELNVKLTLNIKYYAKNLIYLLPYADYIKIFFEGNFCNKKMYKELCDFIVIVSNYKNNKSFVMVKSNINKKSVKIYEKFIKFILSKNIDLFFLSKELLPINFKQNIKFNKQKRIRYLENKYLNRFKSVKNLNTLYYDRFCLNNNNSKKCFVCRLSPYVIADKLYPCKVSKILENYCLGKLSNIDKNSQKFILDKCGKTCDDCASIFENDFLFRVEQFMNKCHSKKIRFYLEIDDFPIVRVLNYTYVNEVLSYSINISNNNKTYILEKYINNVAKEFTLKEFGKPVTLIANGYKIIEYFGIDDKFIIRQFVNKNGYVVESIINFSKQNWISGEIYKYIDMKLSIICVGNNIKIYKKESFDQMHKDGFIDDHTYRYFIKLLKTTMKRIKKYGINSMIKI